MELYQKIKKVRNEMGLSIRDVYYRQVDIFGPMKAMSYRTLLRIEKGRIAKFSSILKICCVLGVSLGDMLKDTEFEHHLLIKKNERFDEYIYNNKASASVISSPNSSYLSLELSLLPLGKTAIEQSPSGKGRFEKWVYVVEGRLTCVIGQQTFELTNKDTLTFDSQIPHYFENKTTKRCQAVLITNPKHF